MLLWTPTRVQGCCGQELSGNVEADGDQAGVPATAVLGLAKGTHDAKKISPVDELSKWDKWYIVDIVDLSRF